MGFQPRQPGDTSKRIVGEQQSAFGYLRRQVWTNVADANTTAILNAESVNGAAHSVTTFAGQPDFARTLQVVCSGANTDDVVITGTNIRGEVISETVTLNGTTPVLTTKAFKTVTQVDLLQQAGETVSIGTSVKLGLDRCMSGNEVILATMDGVYEATRPTVTFHATDVSKNTVDPNTAYDGSKDLAVVFVSTEKTQKLGTTA